MATNRVKLEEVINQAKAAMESGNADEAIRLCHFIHRYYPRCLETTRILGEAYTEKRMLDEADRLFTYVLSGDPQDVLGYVDRGFVSYERGQVDEAIIYYERALEVDPNIEQLRIELLRLYRERYGSSRAKIRMTKAGLANQRLRDGFHNQAIEEYINILRETPDRLDVRVGLMEAYWRIGDYPRAEGLALELVAEYNYLIKANLVLWHIYGVRRNQERAQGYIEKATALDPLHLVAERLFEDTSSARETLRYLSMLGTPFIPEPAPSALSEAQQKASIIPAWVSADPKTDIALGLKGLPVDEPLTPEPFGESDILSSDWLARLLEDSAQIIEERQEKEALQSLDEIRKADQDAFSLFDELPAQPIDLNAKSFQPKIDADDLGAFDLELSDPSKPLGLPERFDAFAIEDAPVFTPAVPEQPVETVEKKKANPLDFSDFGDLELESFEPDIPAFDPSAKAKLSSPSAPFSFSDEPKSQDVKPFDLNFAEEEFQPFELNQVVQAEEAQPFDLGFEEKPAQKSVESSFKADKPEEIAPFDLGLDIKEAAGFKSFDLGFEIPEEQTVKSAFEPKAEDFLSGMKAPSVADADIEPFDLGFSAKEDTLKPFDLGIEPKTDENRLSPFSLGDDGDMVKPSSAGFTDEIIPFELNSEAEEIGATERGLSEAFELTLEEVPTPPPPKPADVTEFTPEREVFIAGQFDNAGTSHEEDEKFVNLLLESDAPLLGDEPEEMGQALGMIDLAESSPSSTAAKTTAPLLPDYAFYDRDERGIIPDFVRESAQDEGYATEVFSGAPTTAGVLADFEDSSKESEDMPIRRGSPDEDKELFDWEKEELPDYLRAFALDTDEVEKQRLTAPNAPIADVTTSAARIRPRKPDNGSPNDLPDWLSPNAPQPDGDLPNWLDASEQSPPPFSPVDEFGGLQPFNVDTGDAFGGASLQPPPQLSNRMTPADFAQSAPTPPKTGGFGQLDMGGDPQIPDDLPLAPFSFGEEFGAPPSPPPPSRPPTSSPSAPKSGGFGQLDMGGDPQLPKDVPVTPFNPFGDDFAAPAPPPSRPSAPPPSAPKPGGFGQLDMGGDPQLPDDLPLTPFNPFGNDFGAPPTPPPPSRPSAPPPAQAGGFPGLDDLAPFNPLGDAPTVPPRPSAPSQPGGFGGNQPAKPGADDLAPFNPFGSDFGAPPTPPPPSRPSAPPPSAPKPGGFGQLDMGGDPQLPDDLPLTPFNPFGNDFGAPPTPPPPSRPSAPPPAQAGGFPGLDDLAPFNPFGSDAPAGGGIPGMPPMPDPTAGQAGFTPLSGGGLKDILNAQQGGRPPAPSKPNNAAPFGFPGGAGLNLPDNLDSPDISAFDPDSFSLDIPGMNNAVANNRIDPEAYPSQPYFPGTGRLRQPEPEFEVEPGQEKPLRGFSWLKNRRKESEQKPSDESLSIRDKMRQRKQQTEHERGVSFSQPANEPFLQDDNPLEGLEAFEAIPSFDEVERLAETGATSFPQPAPSPSTFDSLHLGAEPVQDMPAAFNLDFGEPNQAQPFSAGNEPAFDFGQTQAELSTKLSDDFTFDIKEEKPLFDPSSMSFDLGEMSRPMQVPPPQEPFSLGAKDEELPSFDFGLAESAPAEGFSFFDQPGDKPATFDFGTAEATVGDIMFDPAPDKKESFTFFEPEEASAESTTMPPDFTFFAPEPAQLQPQPEPDFPSFDFEAKEEDEITLRSTEFATLDEPVFDFSATTPKEEPRPGLMSFEEAMRQFDIRLDQPPAVEEELPAFDFGTASVLEDKSEFNVPEPDLEDFNFLDNLTGTPAVEPKIEGFGFGAELSESQEEFKFGDAFIEPVVPKVESIEGFKFDDTPVEPVAPSLESFKFDDLPEPATISPSPSLVEEFKFADEPAPKADNLPDFAFGVKADEPETTLPDFGFAPATTPVAEEKPKVDLPDFSFAATTPSQPVRNEPAAVPSQTTPSLKGQEAVEYYSKMVREKPRDVTANLKLGYAYLDLSQYSQALECFAKIIKQTDKARVDEIVTKLQSLPASEQNTARYHRVLGDAYMKQGYHHWALSEYSKALSVGKK